LAQAWLKFPKLPGIRASRHLAAQAMYDGSQSCRPGQAILLAAVLAAAALPIAECEGLAVAATASAQTAGANLRRPTLLKGSVTTPSPKEATTTRPPPRVPNENVLSIIREIKTFLADEIFHSERQSIVASVALIVGLILVVNGKRFYNGLIIVSISAVVFVMTSNFVASLWEAEDEGEGEAIPESNTLVLIAASEVSVLAAYATWRGIEGVDIIVGLCFGFFVALRLQLALVSGGVETVDVHKGSHVAIVIFYTIVVLTLLVMFRKEGHLRILAFVSPIIGGALTTSAVAWGLTWTASHGYLAFLESALPGLSPVPGPWINFLVMLYEIHVKDYGIFAGSPYNTQVSFLTTDRIAGWIFWLVLTLGGFKLQGVLARCTCKRRRAGARELQRGLLESDE